ncbi:L-asparaginase [Malonomonas rubra DSM 5091]|uniref:L-asparaginase n=1 Tax=Malonomonas rubra DSM 5091 TaxID=1122189 RepID=A0A1M6JBX3_MALRU|nr:asparaginase domain-containing protein [Malonomonas rubra]SHJ44239.1 L-asparaginase [Malonomonas rubra DSM 5091]
MQIEIFTTGGTIDKIYFDAKSNYEIGEPQIVELLRDANLTVDYKVTSLLRKDSLELTDDDRQLIRAAVEKSEAGNVVITHGTDTMISTGLALQGLAGKTIVMTGAMQPARFRFTDAIYNVASAITAAQTLPAGVYIAMNGQIFDPLRSRKNVEMNRFETV